MVTPGLSCRRLALAAGGVLGTTLLGVVVGVIDPAAAGRTEPHPALAGTAGDAVSILANNAAALALPYAMWVLGLARHPISRRLGDLAVATITCQNTVPVGIALAHWRSGLLPYIPQLPLEWAALSTSVVAWLSARGAHATGRALTGLAALTLDAADGGRQPGDLGHTAPGRSAVGERAPTGRHRPRSALHGGCRWVPSPRILHRRRPGRCKVTGSLPLTAFGSARPSGRC